VELGASRFSRRQKLGEEIHELLKEIGEDA